MSLGRDSQADCVARRFSCRGQLAKLRAAPPFPLVVCIQGAICLDEYQANLETVSQSLEIPPVLLRT